MYVKIYERLVERLIFMSREQTMLEVGIDEQIFPGMRHFVLRLTLT